MEWLLLVNKVILSNNLTMAVNIEWQEWKIRYDLFDFIFIQKKS